MSWPLTSLFASLTGTLVLFITYLALYVHYRHRHLAWWSWGWVLYLVMLAAMLGQQLGQVHPLLPALQYVSALAGVWVLCRGVHTFLGRAPAPAGDWLLALAMVYAVAGMLLGLPRPWVCIPVYLLMGLMLVLAGLVILRQRRLGHLPEGVASALSGWSLIFWGLHRADYPFLKDIAWLAPAGFILASALTTLVALALLVMSFERLSQEAAKSREELEQSRQTLDSILAAAPVGVGLIKDRRVLWANQAAYRLTGYPPGSWLNKDLTAIYATPEEYARVGAAIYGQLAAYGYGTGQTVVRRQDGSLLPCQLQVLPVNPEDHDQGYIFAFTDLSERLAAEKELRRTSRVLQAIQQCQRAMLHAQDEAALMAEVCRIICESGGYRLAWVGLREDGEGGRLRPAASWGHVDGYLDTAAVSASGDHPRGRGPMGEALRSGRPQVVQDVRDPHADPAFAPWREEAIKRGYASVLGLPLIHQKRAFGVLGIYAREANAFSQEEVGFLEGLAQDLAFGLEALRLGETRRLYQTLVDTSPDTIMLIANGGYIVACNQAVAQRLGKRVGELVGTQVADHVPPEVAQRRKEAGLRVLATGQPLEFREEARGRMYEYRMLPVAGRDGKPHYIAVFARDITERQAGEQELEASINNYRTLTQHSLQGIAILESDPTHFAYVNPRMTEIFGYSAEEFDALGPDEMWKLVHPGDQHMVRSRAESRLAGQTPPPRYEFRIVRKDGGVRWVEVFSALTEHRGKPASQLAYIDITERKQAEEALRQAEAKYRLLVETSNDGIAVAQDGRPVFFNQRMQEITGYSPEEYVGQPFIEFVHPEDRPLVLERYRRRVAGEASPTGYDFRLINKQGEVRWLFINSSPIEWEGRPATLNTFTDLTPRKLAEEALRESQEEYRRIVETALEGVWAADREGVTTYVNQRVAQMTGYTVAELIGKNIDELMAPEQAGEHQRQMAARRSLERGAYERKFIRKDGSAFWTMISAVPQTDAQGGYNGSFAMLTDITERKQAEQALRESEQRFRLLADHSSDLVCLHDLQLTINYVSPSSAHLLGLAPEELVGLGIASFVHPDDLPRVTDLIARGARGEADTPLRNENRLRKKDGGYVWVESLGSPVLGADGEVKYILVVSRDITERKRNEATLLQMAAGVAHNFNNVLMAIMSNAQAAQASLEQSRRDPAEIRSLLDNVVQGAMGGRDVVQRLSRYVGGHRESLESPEVVDLGGLLRSLRRLIEGMGGLAPDSGLEMSLALDDGLNVLGAGGELNEVFLNLAKNAMEAMPQGGRLDIGGRVEEGQVVVTFADHGPGVDELALGRFFEPFYTTKGVAGQGLGLTVSRAIVAAHGGRLEATSRPGQGTTLTVRLPLAQTTPAAARPARPKRVKTAWPLKVLLVEDEALVAMGIVSTLRKAGHLAMHCSTLAQAVEDLPAFEPDIILCDLGLPDGAGWEVCSRLAQAAELAGQPDTPLVVLSGWSSEQIQAQGGSPCQAAAFLQKPVESDRLLQVLARSARQRLGDPEAAD